MLLVAASPAAAAWSPPLRVSSDGQGGDLEVDALVDEGR